MAALVVICVIGLYIVWMMVKYNKNLKRKRKTQQAL